MRLAWFRQLSLSDATPFDDSAAAIVALGHTHEVDVYTPANADSFAAAHAHAPYDLPIYELPPSPWRSFTHALEARYPGLAVSIADRPVGWGTPHENLGRGKRRTSALTCGLIGDKEDEAAHTAVQRARALGARVEIFVGDPALVIERADIVLALGIPMNGDQISPALAALAARLPVVIFDMEATALWPSLDPQTWRRRGPAASGQPAVVSIDLRDREHSLLLAIRRLSADADFRQQLANSGFEWWQGHATLRHAVQEWERLIAAAASSHP